MFLKCKNDPNVFCPLKDGSVDMCQKRPFYDRIVDHAAMMLPKFSNNLDGKNRPSKSGNINTKLMKKLKFYRIIIWVQWSQDTSFVWFMLRMFKNLRTLFSIYVNVANSSSRCIVVHYWISNQVRCNETPRNCGSRSRPIPFVPLELWGLCNTRKCIHLFTCLKYKESSL